MIKFALWFGGTLMLSACASTQLLPDEGPTTLAVYETHLAGLRFDSPHDQRPPGGPARAAVIPPALEPIDLAYRPPSRRAVQQMSDLNRDFRYVPNPQVLGYRYPHTQDQLVVPGHYSVFPLYEREHYAQPGEGRVEYRP